MRMRYFLTGMAVAGLAVGAVLLVSSCAKQTETGTQKKTPTEQPEEVSDRANVDMKDFTFNPGTVTIKKGGTVIWTNRDAVAHTVTGEDFESGEIGTNKIFSRKFDTPGTYEYKCSIHPSMTGQVVVK